MGFGENGGGADPNAATKTELNQTNDNLNDTNHNVTLTNWQLQNQLNLTNMPQKDGFTDYFVDETHTNTTDTTLIYDAAGDKYETPDPVLVSDDYDLNLTIDQPNGTTAFTDASSNALTVTNNGGTDFETDASAYDGASTSIVFDGSTQYLSVADTAAWDLGADNDLIAEFAFNADDVTGTKSIMSRWELDFSKRSMMFLQEGSDLNYYISEDGTTDGASTTVLSSISASTWYHILFIYNRPSNQVRVFVNGVLNYEDAESRVPFATDTPWTIGARRTGTGSSADNYFAGKVGLVRMMSGDRRYLGLVDTDDIAQSEDFVLQGKGNADTSATFTDLSTNASTITPQGGLTWVNDASPYSNDHATSAALDGTDDVIEVDSTFFDESQDITVEAVFYPDAAGLAPSLDGQADLGLVTGTSHAAGSSNYILVSNGSGSIQVPSATGVDAVTGPDENISALDYTGTDMRTYEGTIGFDETDFIDVQGSVDFSISFWCKIANNTGEKGSAISYSKYGNTWDDQIFTLRINNDTISLIAAATGSSATSFASTSGFIDAGNWMHVTVVKSGSTISFYKNHVLFDSGTLSNGATIHTGDGTDRWRVGFNAQTDINRTFVGELAGFKGYNYALTAQQITDANNADFKPLVVQDDNASARSWGIVLSPEMDSAYLIRTTDGASGTLDRLAAIGLGVEADDWNHLRFTFDQSTGVFTAFKDEFQRSTATGPVLSIFSTTDDIQIGGRAGSSEYFDGKIAGFKITNSIIFSTMDSDYASLINEPSTFSDPYTDLSPASQDLNGNYVSLTEVADADPTEIRLLCLIETNGVLNTDVIGEVSRDGGTTWTSVTLEYTVAFEGAVSCAASDPVDVTGQPSGTNVVGRIRSINDAATDVHGFSMGW